jgi:hypothetical protein
MTVQAADSTASRCWKRESNHAYARFVYKHLLKRRIFQ